MLTFILGGARSGKTRFAQSLCPREGRVAYIATALAADDEMCARIARHRADRPASWITMEEPLALAAAVRSAAGESDFVLVDCLTVWLSNFSWEHRGRAAAEIEAAAIAEVELIRDVPRLILVANEVGGGIVPEAPVGRAFRDLQGLVNQRVAAMADEVFLTVAGIPLCIKGARR